MSVAAQPLRAPALGATEDSLGQTRFRSPALALQSVPSMDLAARLTLALAVTLPACGVADASTSASQEVEMTSGGEQRVLGKRAFDSAAAGYAPLVRLSTEAPRRTLARANDRLEGLERDLACMRAHTYAAELAAELVRAEQLMLASREAIESSETGEKITDEEVDAVVALVGEAQSVLDDVRERRVGG